MLDAALSTCKLLELEPTQENRSPSSHKSTKSRSFGTCTEMDIDGGLEGLCDLLRDCPIMVDAPLKTAPAMAGNEGGVASAFASHELPVVHQVRQRYFLPHAYCKMRRSAHAKRLTVHCCRAKVIQREQTF